jgi:hypothetical protein
LIEAARSPLIFFRRKKSGKITIKKITIWIF